MQQLGLVPGVLEILIAMLPIACYMHCTVAFKEVHKLVCLSAGVLFRAYPDPWQVLRRQRDRLQLVHTQDTMPVLKHVALNILSQA